MRRDVAFELPHTDQIRRHGRIVVHVTYLRISECAELLGVSDDTVRRWVDQGRLPTVRNSSGRLAVEGKALADLAREMADDPPRRAIVGGSARNRFRGIVTRVVKDTVMAQVEMQAGPFRVVSLMSREAADELKLAPGVLAEASVKSTHVVIELPASR